jgi:tyrosine-protein phosphatase YwqE
MGFFSKLFKSEKPGEPIDLATIGVDMHSHFIPGIDDGAKTMKDSVAMITTMAELGYKKVITTPHIMGDFFRNTPEIINTGLEQVRRAVKDAGIEIEIEAAAEYYFDFEFEKKLETERLLTMGDNYLLFEVSYVNFPDNLDGLIFRMQTGGYKPILAHPERYPYWFRDMKNFERLKDKGVFFQLNINSLTGHYSPETARIANLMIDKGWYEFVGSDCHHTGHLELIQRVRSAPGLRKLVESGKLMNSKL